MAWLEGITMYGQAISTFHKPDTGDLSGLWHLTLTLTLPSWTLTLKDESDAFLDNRSARQQTAVSKLKKLRKSASFLGFGVENWAPFGLLTLHISVTLY
jgi:hypothetical protein